LPEPLIVTAPASSANLGPGFDTLAVALDLSNVVRIEQRPGSLEVRVEGEGADVLPADETNLVCRALASGIGDLDGLEIVCKNRIPLRRGLGSSSSAICAGLVAANALGGLRWAPDDLLARATEFEGHADNAAACLEGGCVAVAPGPRAVRVTLPEELAFVLVIPDLTVATNDARGALPEQVSLEAAAKTLCHGIGLALALTDGRLDELGDFLEDHLHEPYRGPQVPAVEGLRALADGEGCLGATVSGSGPAMLLWCRVDAVEEVAGAAESVLSDAGEHGRARISKVAPTGVRARWGGANEAQLAKAIG
jgi:homoserine kinase